MRCAATRGVIRWRAMMLLTVLLGAGAPRVARAQPQPAAPRVDVAAGVGWTTGSALGTRDAVLVGAGTPAGGDFVLFRTDTRHEAAAALLVRVGVRIAGGWVAEGGVTVARPDLETTISGDVEQGGSSRAVTTLREFVFDGGVRHEWRRARARVVPFLRGNVGYLRQLSDDRAVVESGVRAECGGGVIVPVIRRRGAPRELGVRGDVVATIRRGGFDIDEETVSTRVGVGVAIAAYVGF